MKKRVLSILLTVCMLLTLMPTMALATGDTTNEAKIGETNYATLVEAVAAATTGQTVTLLRDASGSGIGTFATPGDSLIGVKDFTIDFGGHTYTCTGPAVGSSGTQSQAFHLEKGANVTLKNGTINTAANSGVKMLVQNYCNLTLDNMTLDGTNLDAGNVGYYTLSNNCGNISVQDTKIVAHATVAEPTVGTLGKAFAFDVDYKTAYPSGAHVTVSGNSEIVGAIEVSSNAASSLIIEGGAFTDLSNAIQYAQSGATIKLAADVTVGTMIMLGKTITLDLNGHKISTTGNDFIQVIDGATLTVDGTTANSELYGRINVGIATNNNGNVVLSGGTYSCKDEQTVLHINGTCLDSDVTIKNATITSPTDNGIQLNGAGTFLIENSTITGATAVYVKSGVLTIKNCNLTGTMSPANYTYNGNGANATGDAIVVDSCNYPGGAPVVNIESGSFSGTKAAVGEYLSNSGTVATISISGGTFSADPAAYLAQGCSAAAAERTWTVTGPATSITANDVTTNYATLVEAVAAATAGQTVTLLRDASGSGIGTFATPGDSLIGVKDFTIDFGGHTYTCTGPAVGSSGTQSQAFHLEKGANVTLKNGTINTAANSGVKMLVQNYCNLTLDNMTLDGTNLDAGNVGYYTLSNNCGNISVQDTKIVAHATVAEPTVGTLGKAFAFDVDYKTAYPSGAHVTVSGNSEIVGAIEVSSNEASSLVIKGGAFTDLSNAIQYAQSDATIKLAADVTLTDTLTINTDKVINLDLNGHTISRANRVIMVEKGTLNVIGTGTIQETDNDGYGAINIKGSQTATDTNWTTVTVGENVILRAWAGIMITPYASSGNPHAYGVTVNFNGTIITPAQDTHTAEGSGMYINGQIQDTTNCPVINIGSTGVVNARLGGGIYAAGYADWTIADGASITGPSGIEIKAGTMAINGGTITATAEATGHTANNNGTSTTGYALTAVNNPAYAGYPLVTINGGTFMGPVAIVDDDSDSTNNNANITITSGTFSDLSGLAYTPSGRSYTLIANYTLAAGKTASVPAGVTLVIPSGVTLTNYGTIVNAGIITNNGTFNNYGTLQGSAVGSGEGAATGDVDEVKDEVAAAKDADVTSDEGKTAVKNAVAAVAEVPNEALNDAATLDNLAALEEKLKTANASITSSAALATEDGSVPDATITGVTVQNAALSVDPNVTQNTEAKVTISSADKPANVETAAAAAVGQAIAGTAKIIPIAIDLTIGAETNQQPKVPLVIKLKVNMTEETAKKVVIVHYKDDANTQTEIILPSVVVEDSNVFLQFSTTSLSTFVVVETPVTVNPYKYEFTLTPVQSNVNAGGKVDYTVSVKRTAGTAVNASQFQLVLDYNAAQLSNPSFAAYGSNGVTGGVYNTGKAQVAQTSAMTIGTDNVTLGTLSFTVAANVADMTTLTLTPDTNQTYVSNAGYGKTASVDVTVGDASARLVTLTFKGDGNTVLYQKYGVNGLYNNAACTGETVIAPVPTATTGYELLDDTWTTAGGADYSASTAYTTSMVFLRSQGMKRAVTVPANVTVASGLKTDTDSSKYVVEGQTADVVFSVTPTTGLAVKSVSYTVTGGTAQTLTASGGNYTIPAAAFTGAIAITVEYNVSITDVRVFTTTVGDQAAFVKFSMYSGDDTLVLFNVTAPDGQKLQIKNDGPTIYKMTNSPYGGTQQFAVLLPSASAATVDAAGMTAYLAANTAFVSGAQTEISYNYNTNGFAGPNGEDANAAYDFSSMAAGTGWHWTPTDNLLLIADVLNYTAGTYTLGTGNANGKVDADDISVFLYTYARFPRPVSG